jgi:hypothetical protein
MHGVQHGLDWTELHVSFSENVSGLFSETEWGGHQYNDQDYLQFTGSNYELRFGRMDSGFGFGSWADLWYWPITNAPICRFMPLADGIDLMNSGSGLDIKSWNGAWQTEFGIYDQALSDHQTLPKRLQFERARLQLTRGNAIVGLNALARDANVSSSPHALGIDYRYSEPRLLARGEIVQGYGAGHSNGFYSDLTYRPPYFYRTQLATRFEGFHGAGSCTLYTAGIRQIVNQNLAVSVNYSWGAVPDFLSSMRGWHLQFGFGARLQ